MLVLRPFRCVIGQTSPANELDGRVFWDVMNGQEIVIRAGPWARLGAQHAGSPGKSRESSYSGRDQSPMEIQALKLEIKQLLIAELDLRGKTEADISDDAPLFGAGLGLDSLDALQIAAALEERYGITIPDGDEAKHIFASVASIASHVLANRKAS